VNTVSSRLPVPLASALPVSGGRRSTAKSGGSAADSSAAVPAALPEVIPEVVPEVLPAGAAPWRGSRTGQAGGGDSGNRGSGHDGGSGAGRVPLALEDQRHRAGADRTTTGAGTGGNMAVSDAAARAGANAQDTTPAGITAVAAGGASGFVAQSLYQESVGQGLYHERWRDGLAAYRRVQDGPAPAPAFRLSIG